MRDIFTHATMQHGPSHLMMTPSTQQGQRYMFQFQGSDLRELKHFRKESSIIAAAPSVSTSEMSRTSRSRVLLDIDDRREAHRWT